MSKTKQPKNAVAYLQNQALPAEAVTAAKITYEPEKDQLRIPYPGTDVGQLRMLTPGTGPKFVVYGDWNKQLYFAPLPPTSKTKWDRVKTDARTPIYWCEGPLKALAHSWHSGKSTIAGGGLDGWGSAKHPSDDFRDIAWKDRPFIILVDSDAAQKTPGQQSIRRLYDFIEFLGGKPKLKKIPSLNGGKTDVNNIIAARTIKAINDIEPINISTEWGADDATQELNRRHVFIMNGGRAEVITEHDDPEWPGTQSIAISQVKDLRLNYLNDLVEVGINSKGEPIFKSKFEVWLASPYRRQAKRLWFKPGAPWGLDPVTGEFNLWQGWAVEPHAPDDKHSWSRLKEHIRKVVAQNNSAHTDYILRWMAFAIQKPATVPEVAIVTQGGEGTGKGIVFKSLGHLFGRHFAHLTQKTHVTGNFNEHMKDKLLIFADESFYAGDKAAGNTLKSMITEGTVMIEAKYANAYSLPNYRKLVIASNESWVVAADADARRYAVFQVSEVKKGDLSYFAAIVNQLKDGGYQAMLYELSHMDLSSFDPRNIPHTNALLDQKKQGFSPTEQWWFELLCDSTEKTWKTFLLRSYVQTQVEQFCESQYHRKSLATRIGMAFRKFCPQIKDERQTVDTRQERGYAVPTLAQSRVAFEHYIKCQIDWATGELKEPK